MNEPEMNSPAPADLSEQVAALQRQVFTLLLALIVVSGTLTVFLYRQASLTGKDIATIKPQAHQLMQVYKQNLPNMETFVNQLVAYGQTHPDFRPILQKYGINPAAPPRLRSRRRQFRAAVRAKIRLWRTTPAATRTIRVCLLMAVVND